METIFVFIIGLIIGSFLNVCIYRIPRDESISYPPSHCTSCGNRIKWYDLIPVVSYMILGGKCRNCKEKISIKYPAVELLTGLIFTGLYLKYGRALDFFKFALFASFLIIIGIIDFETTDVYLKTTLPGIIIGLVFTAAGSFMGMGFMEYIYGALLGGGLIAVIILITHGMGWGDAEICLMCGIFLGLRLTIVMLFWAFVIGGAAGILLILLKKKTQKDYIPFGPFIALAAVITVFIGQNMISWYLSLI